MIHWFRPRVNLRYVEHINSIKTQLKIVKTVYYSNDITKKYIISTQLHGIDGSLNYFVNFNYEV